jgi:hypothetical protein
LRIEVFKDLKDFSISNMRFKDSKGIEDFKDSRIIQDFEIWRYFQGFLGGFTF